MNGLPLEARLNGMDVVQHGVSMLLRNLGSAARLSAGPALIAVAITAVLAWMGLGSFASLMASSGAELSPEEAAAAASQLGWGLFFGSIVSTVVWLFVLSWVAVAWHRHVLLEERTTLLPPLRQDLVWPYLGRTILLAIVLVLLAIPVTFVLGLLLAVSDSLAMVFVVGLLTWFALGWVAMRLSLVLPARAVDRPMSFGESWAATDPASGAIAMVVLALAALNVVLSLVLQQLGSNLATTLLSLLVQWFTAMLGLSVLTTLYGTLVQRRPLAV